MSAIFLFHTQKTQVKPVKCIGVMRLIDRCDTRQRERLPSGTRWVMYSDTTVHLWQNHGGIANKSAMRIIRFWIKDQVNRKLTPPTLLRTTSNVPTSNPMIQIIGITTISQ